MTVGSPHHHALLVETRRAVEHGEVADVLDEDTGGFGAQHAG